MTIISMIIGIVRSAVHAARAIGIAARALIPPAAAFRTLLTVAASSFALSPGSVVGCAIQHHWGLILFGVVLLVEAVEIAWILSTAVPIAVIHDTPVSSAPLSFLLTTNHPGINK